MSTLHESPLRCIQTPDFSPRCGRILVVLAIGAGFFGLLGCGGNQKPRSSNRVPAHRASAVNVANPTDSAAGTHTTTLVEALPGTTFHSTLRQDEN